jgi:hypothetical protein
LRDGSDRWALVAVTLVWVVAALAAGLGRRGTAHEAGIARLRIWGLGLFALVLYFALPFDIRGAIYYLNTRYAHLAAALLASALPPLSARLRPAFLVAGAGAAVLLAVPLVRAFRGFDDEAAPLLRFAVLTPAGPRVMGLIFNQGTKALTHPVFLHAAAVPARLRGGISNFSFALTAHSPLRYRGAPPPTFASEWRPDGFRWETMGNAYSHFLLRGVPPERVFGPHLGPDVRVVAREGDSWWLERTAVSAAPFRSGSP